MTGMSLESSAARCGAKAEVKMGCFESRFKVEPSLFNMRALAQVSTGKVHAPLGVDFIISEAYDLGASEGVISGVSVGCSVINLFEEAFNWCCGVPCGFHAVFVGREVIRGDVIIGVVEVGNEGVGVDQDKAMSAIFEADDEVFIGGGEE
jgi:hypothetical protein